VIEDDKKLVYPEKINATVIELAIRLALSGVLLYWSLTIIRPFIETMAWSVVLAVALYPALIWWRNGSVDVED
jgi:predicted PurR-regulated permease PerM